MQNADIEARIEVGDQHREFANEKPKGTEPIRTQKCDVGLFRILKTRSSCAKTTFLSSIAKHVGILSRVHMASARPIPRRNRPRHNARFAPSSWTLSTYLVAAPWLVIERLVLGAERRLRSRRGRSGGGNGVPQKLNFRAMLNDHSACPEWIVNLVRMVASDMPP